MPRVRVSNTEPDIQLTHPLVNRAMQARARKFQSVSVKPPCVVIQMIKQKTLRSEYA